MRNHTDKFDEAIKSFGRQQSLKLTLANGAILGDEQINTISYSFQGALLKSIMQAVVIDSNVPIDKGTTFNYKWGLLVGNDFEYLDYGNFIVYSVEKKEDTYSYEIKAYDKMLYSMKDYEKVDCTYPCTLDSYVKALCKKLGYTLKTTTYANMNKTIDRDFFTEINYTYRDVLDDIAEVTASTIYLKGTNLYLGQPKETNITIDEEYIKDINVKFGEKYGPINSVILSRSGGSDNIYLKDDESINKNGLCEIKINDNQIMNLNNRSEYLQDILDTLKGKTYYINNFLSTGVGYIELLDYYNVKIGNQTYNCLMLNNEQDVSQGFEETINTSMPEQAETNYKKSDKTDQKINQTYLIVDKQNQTIEGLIQKNEDTQAKVTKIEADLDGITTNVVKKEDLTNEKIGYGTITLDNVSDNSEPIYIDIRPTGLPIKSLYPSNNLYPNDSLYPHNREIYFIPSNEINKTITFNIPEDLYYISDKVYDEYILDYLNQESYVIKRTNYNSETGELTVLDKQIKNVYKYPQIILKEGEYKISIPSVETAYIDIKYMIKNNYTQQLTTKIEVDSKISQSAEEIKTEVSKNYATKGELATEKSEIKQTTDEISTSVSKKVGKDEIISTINQSAEKVTINANKININGTISANGNFQVDKSGNLIAKNGQFGGTVNATTGTFSNIITDKGMLTNLHYESMGDYSGFSMCGFLANYETNSVVKNSIQMVFRLPDKFTVSQAYISLIYSAIYGDYVVVVGDDTQSRATKGFPRNIKLYLANSLSIGALSYGYGTEYYLDGTSSFGSQVVSGDFTSGGWTDENASYTNLSIKKTNNVANLFSNNGQYFGVYVSTGATTSSTVQNDQDALSKTFRGKILVDMLGYIKT